MAGGAPLLRLYSWFSWLRLVTKCLVRTFLGKAEAHGTRPPPGTTAKYHAIRIPVDIGMFWSAHDPPVPRPPRQRQPNLNPQIILRHALSFHAGWGLVYPSRFSSGLGLGAIGGAACRFPADISPGQSRCNHACSSCDHPATLCRFARLNSKMLLFAATKGPGRRASSTQKGGACRVACQSARRSRATRL